MYQPKLNDTIVAISTAAGHGGIGIIRLSGKKALSIADKMFLGKSKSKPSQFKTHTVHYGNIVVRRASSVVRKINNKTQGAPRTTQDEIVDEILLTVMRAPKSYTCEDIVEISSHGGLIPMRAILRIAIDYGARLAEPGEFTKRAYLNGRIDLTQAEAVLDIINSQTDAFLKVSLNQLKGELTTELELIRETLMSIYTHLEAIVNFPEDEVDPASQKELLRKLKGEQEKIAALLKTADQGKVLKEGIRVVICGKPNVGKSSLLNVLLKEPRAIVTDIAGTTRDTIEETAQIKGIPFQLVDTAGILEPRDLVEKEAVKRSHIYIESADLILFVIDSSRALAKEDFDLIDKIQKNNVLVVVNKCDLKTKFEKKKMSPLLQVKKFVEVSALKKIGLKELEDAIVENVWHGKVVDTPRLLVSNLRHIESLQKADRALLKAVDVVSRDQPFELASEEIKAAVNHLDQITGKNVDADLIDKIFMEFCIGK